MSAWMPQDMPVSGAPPSSKGGKPPSSSKPKGGNAKSWNDPEKIDSFFGWLLLAVVGGGIFVMLGQNLIPYWDYFSQVGSWMFQAWRGRNLLWFIPIGSIIYWGSNIAGGLLGVGLFLVIQFTEIRPQLLSKRLPQGPERNRRLTAAFILMLCALALDAFFCFLFWPPVNSALGWGVFRAGFSWQLVNKWNMVRTFFTLFGGIIFLAVHDYIKKNW